ncbi:MAG: NADH-quinone oxidoreductase subunit D-related protein [Bdellovibrionota bacterium]
MATRLTYSPAHLAGTQGLGAFGLVLEEDGGLVAGAQMTVGYGRREIENTAVRVPLSQALNYADRIDFLASPAYNCVLSSAFEELLDLEVPERAHHIRLILLELNRINSHLQFYVNLARVLGQQPLMNHCLRERERFSDILEMYCGSRLGFGAICVGGVVGDATDGWFFRIEKAISALRDFLPELDELLLSHPFFMERTRGLAVVTREFAEEWNLLGPNARASGLPARDERISRPYGAYRDAAMPDASAPGGGDVLARAAIRASEILQSARLIEDAFRRIPPGNFRIRVGMEVSPAKGLAAASVEGPRGAITVLAESGGGNCPANVRFFSPSVMAVQLLPRLLKGIQAEDAFLVIHSLDISFSEVDK